MVTAIRPGTPYRAVILGLLSSLLAGHVGLVLAAPGVLARIDQRPEQFFAPKFIREVYVRADDQTLWRNGRITDLLELIDAADEHGLTPADYLRDRLAALDDLDRLEGVARIDADLLATEAFLRYGYHLQYGKVDPVAIDAAWNYGREVDVADPAQIVVQLIRSPRLDAAIGPLVRHGPLYGRLREWLQTYRRMAERGGWPPFGAGPTLHPGDRDPRVQELRLRLRAEGFASGSDDPDFFDEQLATQVRAWQERHGLEADGLVGAKSVAALGEAVETLIDRLRINLERLRWAAPERQERTLLVNIAGFELQLRGAGKVRWSTRVVVGKPYRQTPVFRASMTHLVFNPDWTVPPTILRNDTLPALRKDAGYLVKQHMDVVNASGKPVNPATLEWSTFANQRFPYFIRQRPGPWNALGHVKFIFPNDHFVFLHDTPSRELFARQERSFSSGCIRVEDPLTLATLLLEDQAGYAREDIEAMVATGETRTVFLKEPLPVLLQYLTAVQLENGPFRFHRDIYKRDAKVLVALDAAPPGVPAELPASAR